MPERPAVGRPLPKPPVFDDFEEKVVGINPVLELLRSGSRTVDTVYIDKEKGGPHFTDMVALARRTGIKMKVVPRDALDNMSGGLRHQGALAVVAPKAYEDIDALVGKMALKAKSGTPPLLVVLDGVEDPHNLGSIIRTAESAGADGVVIPEHRAAHLTASVARASAGAVEYMPVAKVVNVAEFLARLKAKGFWVVGLDEDAKTDYTSFDMTVPLAVVMGGEGKGLRPLVAKACDAVLSLPMLGKVDSLNVSVSAGVVLYEAVRQRRAAAAKH